MNATYPPDGDTPSENGDMQDLLRRFSVLEQNQRDMLFLLRSMRVALFNARVELLSRITLSDGAESTVFDGLSPAEQKPATVLAAVKDKPFGWPPSGAHP